MWLYLDLNSRLGQTALKRSAKHMSVGESYWCEVVAHFFTKLAFTERFGCFTSSEKLRSSETSGRLFY